MSWLRTVCWIGVWAVGGGLGAVALLAEDPVDGKPAPPKSPLAIYLSVGSPLSDAVQAKVLNAARKVQQQADQEGRPAVLILEISPGTSKFGQVRDLAKELTSAKFAALRTIAWIPEPKDKKRIDGYNVILAIACKEIVMHPDAELGDIGRGKALEAEEQQFVLSLVEKRLNPKLSTALVTGLMDPQKNVLKIKLESDVDGRKVSETRVLTKEEHGRLLDNKVVVQDVITVKEAGVIGSFSGSRARALDVLVTQTADARSDLADLYNFPREFLRENATSGETPRVVRIRIDETIEPVLQGFVEREIRRAKSSGVNLILFEIDSPGGMLEPSLQIANTIADLDGKKIRTVAYVPRMALSGAAIIALGCDEIILQKHAKIGDAAPISIRPGQQFERAPEKILSFLRVELKTLADKKGRPSGLCQAMADKDLDVFQVTHRDNGRVSYMTDEEIHVANGEWIKGRIVPECQGEMLLTVDGQRAHELKLAEAPVADEDELRQRLGIPEGEIPQAVGRTWVDTLVWELNTPHMTFLLLLAGSVLIYIELHTMTSFFGIASALCFMLFFWSRFLGGTADVLEVVLFLFGVGLILMEVFVVPGFGIFGVSGALAIFASLVLASQTFVLPSTSSELHQMTRTLGTMSIALVSVIGVAMLISRYLPEMPLLKHLILTPPNMAGDADAPRLRPDMLGSAVATSLDSLLRQEGEAFTTLRPAGKARFGEQVLDVQSQGDFIEAGQKIVVSEISGNKIIVRKA
ncbi:MAG TPA: NfeD family protein [Planctomycetaceae bacterium]|nr:NfeD family protein [Planctomycetaceae bacterium]